MQPGGKWAGDYLVADLRSFTGEKGSLDATPREARIQRISEVSVRKGPPTFPLARLRKQRDESEVIANTSGRLDAVDHAVVQDGIDVEELFTDDPDPPEAPSSAEPYDARGQGDICEITGVPIRR